MFHYLAMSSKGKTLKRRGGRVKLLFYLRQRFKASLRSTAILITLVAL